MKSLLQYLTDVRAEVSHVKWPSTSQAVGYTALVIVISILVAALLGALDYVFAIGIELLINRI